jgi:hypothetical protein
MERCCGNCDYWQEGSLIKGIGNCSVTNELKQAGAYCIKEDYFQIKKRLPKEPNKKNKPN